MLLQVHAKQCQNNDCPVPRCRELREMRRRAVARQEDQRRVAYQAMLRNQNGQVSRPRPTSPFHLAHPAASDWSPFMIPPQPQNTPFCSNSLSPS